MQILTRLVLSLSIIGSCLAKERTWDNKNLDGWPVYIEKTGKSQGWYQLDCTRGRRDGNKKKWKTGFGAEFLDRCERSCRCNAFGEFLLNPMPDEECVDDTFLNGCTHPSQGACVCVWAKSREPDKWDQVKNKWRTDMNSDWQEPTGRKEDLPKVVKPDD